MPALGDNERRSVWAEFMRDLGRRTDQRKPTRMESCELRKHELLKTIGLVDDYVDKVATDPKKTDVSAMRGSRVIRGAIKRLTDDQVNRIVKMLLKVRQQLPSQGSKLSSRGKR